MVLQIKKNNRENLQKLKALEETAKDEVIRITVDLKAKSYKDTKLLCAISERKVKMKDIINEALEEYLKKYLNKEIFK